MASLDELRAAYPHLGFALYAFEPGGDVTLEVHDTGTVLTTTGPTAEAAIAKAFPHFVESLPLVDLFGAAPAPEPPAAAPPVPPRRASGIRPAPTPEELDIPGFLKREPKPATPPTVPPAGNVFD